MALTLKAKSFDQGKTLPQKYTCDGSDVSPGLHWSDPPVGTKSFALIMDDPDAPPGTWVHWVVYNLPPETRSLGENLPKQALLENGAQHGMCWGVKDFSRIGYYGPCPPPGPAHRYFFKLYALDTTLSLSAQATKFDVEKAMLGHTLAATELMGKYGR